MPAITPLTDLATVKSLMGGTPGTTTDTILGYLISAVSASISNYCNRNFLQATYTENYNGSGKAELWLRQRPIQSVTSVTINQAVIPARPNVNAAGFAFDQNKLYYQGGIFWSGAQNVSVVYSAGLPAVSQAATPDLWMAATEWVLAEYKDGQHIEKGSDSAGQGMSTVYLKDMPWHTRRVVDQYRQVAPAGSALGN